MSSNITRELDLSALVENQEGMTAFKAFAVKTATEKVKVLSMIHDHKTRRKVLAAFEEADNEWTIHLARMIGEDKTKKVIEYLKSPIPGMEVE